MTTIHCTSITADVLLTSLEGSTGDALKDEHLRLCDRCRQAREELLDQGRALRLLASGAGSEALRRRIVQAAVDAAWQVALRLLERVAARCVGYERPARTGDRRALDGLLEALGRIDRRLRGLDHDLGLGILPARCPDDRRALARQVAALRARLAGTEPWTLEIEDALRALALRGGAPYQPTAAPSFRDSLAPW